jgi:cytochrome c-type biogenesis protein
MSGGGIGQLVMSGPLVLAAPVALAAGAVTFISPCCLPLVPGYLSYVAGMSGADAQGSADPQTPPGGPSPSVAGTAAGAVAVALVASPPAARSGGAALGRTVAGTALFVLGFSALFASYGAAFGGLGVMLLSHQQVLLQVLGGRRAAAWRGEPSSPARRSGRQQPACRRRTSPGRPSAAEGCARPACAATWSW